MQVDLLQVLEKIVSSSNIQSTRIAPPFEGLENFDYGLRKTLDPQFDWNGFGQQLLAVIPGNTLVMASGAFELHFAFFRVPDEENALFCVGPWRSGERSERSLEWTHRLLDKQANAAIDEYYNGVRIIPDEMMANLLHAVLSLVMPADKLEVIKWEEFMPLNFRPDLHYFSEPAFQRDIPAAMLEERYAHENELLEAVSRGDTTAALSAMERMGRFRLASRFENPMRDRKNKGIIFNTLLRKSIEAASVHPYYIDKISEKYALRIESMTDETDEARILNDMLREYCAYVQRYSLRNYSPLVQKVINHINLNLGSALSLKSLAAMCFISPSYLSNIFKQEVGQTLTDYINTQRIRRASYRLIATDIPVAAVAEDVGILDVNYFTKMFKKTMGSTPTQYRRENRER